MNRGFEFISTLQFIKDLAAFNQSIDEEYFSFIEQKNLQLPTRAKKNSYDISSCINYTLKAGKSAIIPTGLKVFMRSDEVFLLYMRSGIATKYGINLSNQVWIIDSDYCNNKDSEKPLWLVLTNTSDKDFEIKAGEPLCQGLFTKLIIALAYERKGGFGSTTDNINKENDCNIDWDVVKRNTLKAVQKGKARSLLSESLLTDAEIEFVLDMMDGDE